MAGKPGLGRKDGVGEMKGAGESTKILFENAAMITKICTVIKKRNHYNRHQRNSDY